MSVIEAPIRAGRMRARLRLRRWTREIRPLFTLSFPIMAGLISQVLIGLADTILVGKVGVIPLAAASLVNNLAHIPMVFAFGLLSSISVLTAQSYGARQPEQAGETLRHGILIAAAISVFSAVALIALRPHLHRFGQPAEVVAASGTYLVLFAGSMIPALIAHACKQFSEALNRPWVPTFILFGAVILNIALCWILIYGRWGAPALGLEGAGWATLISRLIMMFCMIAYILRSPALRPYHPARWRISLRFQWFRRLLKLGWPVGFQHLMEVGAFVVAALMMGWISANAMAAHQIAVACASTTFMFALGIGMAACIRVGHAWGAGQFARMRRIGFVGLGMAVLIMGGFGLILMLASKPIAGQFIDAPVVVALAAHLLLIAALFQVADGVQVVAISSLRGLTDVRVPALIAVLAYWIIAVPVAYLLAFTFHLGARGIWIGLALGLGTAATCLVWRFHALTRKV